MATPSNPSIFHITHLDNLSSILEDGGLLSDAAMIARGNPQHAIGMNTIKERRLNLPVKCHPGDMVGEYVPFYFCPRSIMLSVIWYANHPELAYRGGQGPILHLVSDVDRAVEWADDAGQRWAFTLSNAGAAYAPFRDDLADLSDIDWAAVRTNNFADPQVKEGKQAEFLVQDFFPWDLVTRIGVLSDGIKARVSAALEGAHHRPPVDVLPRWYF